MVSNPKPGDVVKVCYRKSLKNWFPYEGEIGTVRIVCKARKCRNHGVEIDGKIIVIPCGNLNYYPSRRKKKAIK